MRTDISNCLVHWTRADSLPEAFERLKSIIHQKCLVGGSELRKGSYTTVCFTEAPVDQFHRVTSRYSPFGIKLPKKWAFEKGARPAIYQRDSEFADLSEAIRWRHVRYEPDLPAAIDFSWEREWRIKTEKLSLEGSGFSILLPDKSWCDALFHHHEAREQERIYADVVAYGDWAGMQNPEPFRYRVEILNAQPAA
ncbi:MAG TPA: hypothetical protein VMI53_02955 [Opitutaceae bacterium]|nr:hypothetical protein [Opitutaceae bacterium]